MATGFPNGRTAEQTASPAGRAGQEREHSLGAGGGPVRVAIVTAAPGPLAADAAAPVVEAIRRLGPEVQIEVLHDATAARAAVSTGGVDLVVAHEGLGPDLFALLDTLRDAGGPPAVVVCRGPGEAFAVEAFRHGAADCVLASRDLRETLPVVSLEQLRRWRRHRERLEAERLGRRVDALERLSENVIQNMNSALLVIDGEGCVVYANPAAERLFDASLPGLQGRPISSFFGDRPEGTLLPALSEGARLRGVEALLSREGGSRIPVGISCAPLVDGEGAGSGAVVIIEDRSELQQLQRQVLQTEKMASIGQLAAGVAHEINNPMGFIHANLCQLAEYLDELQRVWERVEALRGAAARARPDPERLREAVAALDETLRAVDADYLLDDFGKAIRESLEGSEGIRHIVQDLRTFSRQDTPERSLADVNKALDSTAHIVWTMMKHSVALTKHYEELPPISCHPMQLKQVFMNLLVNACQAVQERVAQDGGRGEVRLRTQLRDGGIVVRVTDNGLGIPPGVIDRIFEPFFTTKEVGSGTGLGLSTSYTLVQRHGGRIAAESRPGEGSTFEVWLPLDAPEGSA